MPGPNTPGSTGQGKPGTSTADLVASTPDARAEQAQAAAAEANPEAAAAAVPDTSGKRLRAIPTHGGSTVRVTRNVFQSTFGIEHDTVLWDFRKNGNTVKVGEGGEISREAADKLIALEPTRFEYMN